MEWKVGNALSRDTERQHLNKILAEIRSTVNSITTQPSNSVTNTETITNNYAVASFLLTLAGDVTGSQQVDGLNDVTITTTIAPGVVGIEEAPIDNQYYWRWNAEWQPVPPAITDVVYNDEAIPPINFSYGDATPITIYTMNSEAIADLVQIIIRVAFNGTSPQLAIGTAASPELLMPYTYNDPTTVNTYEVSPDALMAAGDDVILTIVPGAGATAGSGQILLSFTNL